MFDMNNFGDGPGGPMISGKWINKRTGETVIIRDSIIDGDKLVLISNKGNLSFDSFSRDYIQASDEVYDDSGRVIKTEAPKVSEIVDKPEKIDLSKAPQSTVDIDTETGEINILNSPISVNNNESKSINNFELIDKIFKKIESKPKADLKITWAGFPEKELSMLVNYFDVKLEDIAQYIGKYLINDNLLNVALLDFLGQKGLK